MGSQSTDTTVSEKETPQVQSSTDLLPAKRQMGEGQISEIEAKRAWQEIEHLSVSNAHFKFVKSAIPQVFLYGVKCC